MDWISLAIAIALLVVAVYSESHTSEKKQSAVYLGDSAAIYHNPLRAPRKRPQGVSGG